MIKGCCPTVSVCVFAYNEEDRIRNCLAAIRSCASEARLLVYVLINGCTDGTERVVRDFSAPEIEIHPVVLSRGDKANAWNNYVHEIAPEEAEIHIFTDGDMVIDQGSVAAFLRCFGSNAYVAGYAGLPGSGRSRDAFAEKLVQGREMAGNLYALRRCCVMEFRRRQIRLPVGLFGEDGLATTIVKWNHNTRGPRDDERVAACPSATFSYVPLSPFRLGDWRIYLKRKMRYAVRQQQANMLYHHIFEEGVEAMPEHVIDLYRAKHSAMELKWNGLDTWFDWVALRRIRRDVAAADDKVREEERAHLYS